MAPDSTVQVYRSCLTIDLCSGTAGPSKKCVLSLENSHYSYPPVESGWHGQGASSSEVPGKHDDIVLVGADRQLAKCSPFPSNGFPGWLALGGSPMAGADQSGRTGLAQSCRTGLNQSDRTGLTCQPVEDHKTSDSSTGNCFGSNSMVWANITYIQRQMHIVLSSEDDLGNLQYMWLVMKTI